MIRRALHRIAPLALAVLVASLPARADELSDLLARAKAAAGGAAWDSVRSIATRVRFETGGLSGPAESIEEIATGRYAETYELGPVRGAGGFDGTVSWEQEPSGQIVASDRGESFETAVNQAWLRSLSLWYPERRKGTVERLGARTEGGRSFEVLKVSPEGGRPFELWLDGASLLIDRTVDRVGPITRTAYSSDYRDVQGVKIAFALRITTGEAKYDQRIAVESVTLNPPFEASRFAPPAERTGDVELADGREAASVPFRLVNNHLIVQVEVDGEGKLNFIFDTGGVNVLTVDAAKRLGIAAEGAIEGRGAGDKSEDVGLARVASVRLGGVLLRDQVFYVFPLAD